MSTREQQLVEELLTALLYETPGDMAALMQLADVLEEGRRETEAQTGRQVLKNFPGDDAGSMHVSYSVEAYLNAPMEEMFMWVTFPNTTIYLAGKWFVYGAHNEAHPRVLLASNSVPPNIFAYMSSLSETELKTSGEFDTNIPDFCILKESTEDNMWEHVVDKCMKHWMGDRVKQYMGIHLCC